MRVGDIPGGGTGGAASIDASGATAVTNGTINSFLIENASAKVAALAGVANAVPYCNTSGVPTINAAKISFNDSTNLLTSAGGVMASDAGGFQGTQIPASRFKLAGDNNERPQLVDNSAVVFEANGNTPGTRIASASAYAWTTSLANNFTTTSRLSESSAGILQVGTTANNASGSLNLTNLTATGTVKTGVYTVATLPAGTAGMRAAVSDATANTYGIAPTGSGAVSAPVFYSASAAAWIIG